MPSIRSFHTNIVGVTHSNPDGTGRQDLLARCKVSERVQFVPEPTNRHDRNAVKVCRMSGDQLGYLRRELAEEIKGDLDRGVIVKANATVFFDDVRQQINALLTSEGLPWLRDDVSYEPDRDDDFGDWPVRRPGFEVLGGGEAKCRTGPGRVHPQDGPHPDRDHRDWGDDGRKAVMARHRPAAPRPFASDPPTLFVFEELARGWRRPGQRVRRCLRAAVRNNRRATWPIGGPPGRDRLSRRHTNRRRRGRVDGLRSAPRPVLRWDHGRIDAARSRTRGCVLLQV
jgi:hypothetical protein